LVQADNKLEVLLWDNSLVEAAQLALEHHDCQDLPGKATNIWQSREQWE
jgi:hypothetical protein